ncbi:Hpt domain-containing protein [Lutibacter sp.]|uniref:Hpt domain-containing protein n=1 Tax=Lutibacter sp. TaxID=1925666 RepID=UPI001A198099|nr:Hpt domain-containing protein [Lutibacter sp.]MBI9039872.1 Hpt domain-containing protein [Lutibacter sp.]
MQLPENSKQVPVKLYDLHLIDKMCRGNQEQVKKMVEVFTNEISQSIEEINSAYSENDFLEIKKLVHKIKPTLKYFGTETLEKEILQIEALFTNEIVTSELRLKLISASNLTKEVVDKMKNDFNITNP